MAETRMTTHEEARSAAAGLTDPVAGFDAGVRWALDHARWAVHARRFDVRGHAPIGPDSFYNGVIKSEVLIAGLLDTYSGAP